MTILGIDNQLCNNCNGCIKDCSSQNFKINEKGTQVIHENSERCILCGHCIAVCPENAIIYEKINGTAIDFEDFNDNTSFDRLYKLLRFKRSIRYYKQEKVPKIMMHEVLDSMRFAPTGINRRTLKCLIISNNLKINEFIDTIIEKIESDEEKELYAKKREDGIDPFFHHAPHIIILYSEKDWDLRNSTIAMTYGMLSAETLGLGTCWIGGVQMFLNENISIQEKVFGIEGGIMGIMTIGYPSIHYFRAPPRPKMVIKEIN